MIKSLAKFSVACVVAISMAGCAATVDEDDETIATSESALHGSFTYTIFARATYDANLDKVMVDLATTDIPPIDTAPTHDPHISTDRFFNVRVREIAPDGSARIMTVLGGLQIGPGGGCIHFSVPAAVGDTLQIDSIVRVGGLGIRAGRTAPVTVVVGDWVNDPTVNMHH